MYAINTTDADGIKRQLEAQGFELAPASAVGHRIIVTGRMVGGSMHTIIPTLELVGIDRQGQPVMHIVHPCDPVADAIGGGK